MHVIYHKEYSDKKATLCNQNVVPFFEMEGLREISFITHGFSTKLGGVSENELSSMNLSFTRGDNPENVYTNYSRICEALNVPRESLVFSDQVHSTNVVRVGKENILGSVSDTKQPPQKLLQGVDGMITNEPGVTLVTFFADCVPLFFVDTKNRAIGLVHSGWRGTAGKIGAIALEKMRKEFGTDPKDVVAAIGPSICKDCYEVSEDLLEEFRVSFTMEQCKRIFQPKGNHKYLLDLWKANEILISEAGVLPENISVSGVCTCCNHELLFSHRYTNGKRGNLNAFLSINSVKI
ncbi:MAG: peptidoglycan editing factor PgeF [Lachnospiraceae bacterium]|nr:peptidoglycan editing factor PgeF [Lachnospiraceae bacterium]